MEIRLRTLVQFCQFVVFLLFTPSAEGIVPLDKMYPFGLYGGDTFVPPGDDGFASVQLQYPFKFFNNTYTSLFVDINGAISFVNGVSTYTPTCGPQSTPMISPYWTDVDITYAGNVSYRETTDRTFCAQATNEIVTAFPEFNGISINWLFIVTWYNTPFYGEIDQCGQTDPSLRNTFQAILATDNVHSFTIFNYNQITWTTGTASGGNCSGLGGVPAKGGFDVGDGVTLYEIPNSCTSNIINIGDNTNTDTPGRFVFKIDNVFESTTCDPNADLMVRSSFIRNYGNIPITIQGPCLHDVNITSNTLSCKLRNTATGILHTIPATILNNNTAECITPYLHAYAEMTVYLSYASNLGGTFNTKKGSFFTVETDPEFYALTYGNSSTIFFYGSWDPALFGDTSLLLDLVLVQSVNYRWTEQSVVLRGIVNDGSQIGNINLTITDDTVPYVFRLTPSNVTALNVFPVSVANYKPSLFSDLQYFGLSYDPATNIALCQTFYVNWTTAPTPADAPCPPLLSQAQQDPRFTPAYQPTQLQIFYEGAEAAYRQRFPGPDYSGHVCTYANGTILVGPKGGGTASMVNPAHMWGQVAHFIYDVRPWYQCCLYSNDDASCRKYYEKRPSDDGSLYVPPRTGGNSGDPHIFTLDGLAYSYNGVGEYWMVKSENFSMQGRMEQYIEADGTRANASVFTAFVMVQYNTDNSTRVQLSAQPLVGFNIIVNDVNIVMDDNQTLPVNLVLTGLSLTIQSSTSIIAAFASGLSFVFTTADQSTSINVVAMANINLYGDLGGLLGYFDGSQSNDLKLRNGTTIPSNSSPQTIHSTFGESWRVDGSETLFNYTLGRSYSDYQNPSFVPNFGISDPESIPSNVQSMCAGDFNCLFDYATTGSILLANDTHNFDTNYNSTVATLNQEVPMCSSVTKPSHGYFTATNYLVGSTVTFGCDSGYILAGSYMTKTCVQSGGNPPHWNHVDPFCKKCEHFTLANLICRLCAPLYYLLPILPTVCIPPCCPL